MVKVKKIINIEDSVGKHLEIYYNPKHGSWLNIAEIELNVMTCQCLSRRIDNISNLRNELSAWEVKHKILSNGRIDFLVGIS